MKKYLIISRYDDEPYMEFLTQTQLEQKLSTEWSNGYTFLSEAPRDLMDFPSKSIFIIKGEIIVPTPKEVVKVWTI